MESTNNSNQAIDFFMKHKYKIIITLLAVIILVVVLIVTINNYQETKQQEVYSETYSTAMKYLREGNPNKAKELFASLPENYANSEYGLAAGQWSQEIDAKYNTDYLGFWGNNYYSIEITQRINVYGLGSSEP